MELPKEIVSVKTKINFSVAGLANGLLNGLVFGNLTFFYQIKLGANGGLLSIAWLIFAVWNTLNDPIASYFIDNTRTKIGRRIPYLRYGSIFYGLAFIFCWFPISPLDSQIGLFWNFLAALFLLDTMFTIVGTCFFSLPNEIAFTAKQRASLGAYTTFFGFINLILGIILPIVLLTGQEGIHPLFVPIILIIGFGSSFILFITSYGIKENLFAQLQERERFVESFKLTLKNKPFWILIVPAFFLQLISQLALTGILYYVDYINEEPIFIGIAFFLGVVIGAITNLKKIGKWGPKRTGITNLLILAFALIGLFFVGLNPIVSTIPFLFIGFGYIGALITTPVLMGDVIDNDEIITGRRREAIYGGVNAVVTKPAVSIANSSFLTIIGAFGFVVPIIINGVDVKQPQSLEALMGILVAFCIFPSIFLIISALVLFKYPLDGPEWLQKKNLVMVLHEKKEKEYLESLVNNNKRKN